MSRCEKCWYIQYDSCCNGYCNCKQNENYKNVVVDDTGCSVEQCTDYVFCFENY